MEKIVSIIGTRPQFIKSVIISRKFSQKKIKHILIHTGQHYDFNMSEIFFSELGLTKPDYYLGVGSGSHGEQTAKMMTLIEQFLLKERANFVIVYGDTNSALAGALVADQLSIPLCHIEAGCRLGDNKRPEERIRRVIDHLSDYLFLNSIFLESAFSTDHHSDAVYDAEKI